MTSLNCFVHTCLDVFKYDIDRRYTTVLQCWSHNDCYMMHLKGTLFCVRFPNYVQNPTFTQHPGSGLDYRNMMYLDGL